MAFSSRGKNAAPRAAGFPVTDEVKTRKLKSGELFLKNGSNLFKLSLQAFSKVSVAPGLEGSYDLVGAQAADGAATVIASFGSERAAQNALEGVSASFAGIGGTFRWKRWLLCIAVAYVLVSMLSSMASQAVGAAVNSRTAQLQQMQQAQPGAGRLTPEALAAVAAPQAAPTPGGFNPQEQSLEELERLAKGGEYQFKPNITVPDMQAPALNCDKSHAGK